MLDLNAAYNDGKGILIRPGDLAEMLPMVPEPLLMAVFQRRAIFESRGVVEAEPKRGEEAYRIVFRHPDSTTRSWIRFHGHYVAYVLRVLLAVFRMERLKRLEVQRKAKQLEKQKAREEKKRIKALRREIIHLGGGGRRRRRRNAKEFDEAVAGGAKELFLYQMNAPYLRPDKPPGRPRKGSLKLTLPDRPASETHT